MEYARIIMFDVKPVHCERIKMSINRLTWTGGERSSFFQNRARCGIIRRFLVKSSKTGTIEKRYLKPVNVKESGYAIVIRATSFKVTTNDYGSSSEHELLEM